jgi:hypothetical protein
MCGHPLMVDDAGEESMMTVTERLKALLGKQKELTDEYQSLIKDSSLMSEINQVEELRSELAEKSERVEKIEEKMRELREQNEKLRITLNEQILDEKLNILKVSRSKMDLYFGRAGSSSDNKLKQMESDFKQKITSLEKKSSGELGEKGRDLAEECRKLEIKIQEELAASRKQLAAEEAALYREYTKELTSLEGHEIDEETVQKRIRQNKIEMKFGQWGISILAALLIIIGIGMAARYGFNRIPDLVKGILFFLGGGLFIGVGEFFFFKKRSAFSNTFIGIGIAVLFAAVFYSHFMLEILEMFPAMVISILVTAVAMALSIVNNSRLVVIYALIGGYLPFLSYGLLFEGFEGNAGYVAMGYMVLLNMLVLVISLFKRWHISTYISFFMHLPAMLFLSSGTPSATIYLVYVAVVFLIYIIDILAWPLIHKQGLLILDLVLLGLNTTVTCLIISRVLFLEIENGDLYRSVMGGIALLFCLVYVVLGLFTSKVLKNEIKTVILFYVTALTFSLMAIPFMLGVESIIFAWVIEGTLLIIAGYLVKNSMFEKGGWVVFWLCLAWFYIVEVFLGIRNLGRHTAYLGVTLFDFKYLAVAVGGLAILGVYFRGISLNVISRFSRMGRYLTAFKYYVFMALYVFVIYALVRLMFEIDNAIPETYLGFFLFAAISVVSMLMGLFLGSRTVFYDKVFKVSSNVFFMLGSLTALSLVVAINVLDPPGTAEIGLKIVSFITLLGLTVVAIASIRYQVINLIRSSSVSAEWYPLLMGIILVLIVTMFVIRQFTLDNISLLLSGVYIGFALLCILYGFWKRFLYVRILGLVLVVIGIIIMFINILIFSETIGRIITVFVFGFVLLGIAIVYQQVNKKFSEHIETTSVKQNGDDT